MRTLRENSLETEINTIFLSYYSLDEHDFSSRMCLANTIQHAAFCADIADYIIEHDKLSVEDFSAVTRMGDNLMDQILQSVPFTEDQKLLLLIEWFDTRPETKDSTAASEEAVEWLFEHIDCAKIDFKLIMGLLGKPNSRFGNSERCR